MTIRIHQLSLACAGLLSAGIASAADSAATAPARSSFQDDLAFLQKSNVDVVLLSNADQSAQVAISPAWQGRVLTSTANGLTGNSLGWINRELIASGKIQDHINAFGGEDRFWVGPEGGQFSVFFAKDSTFDLAHWHTPPIIDTIPWPVVTKASDHVDFHQAFQITNYSGTVFSVVVDREVRLLEGDACWKHLGMAEPSGVKTVAYETDNRLTNAGSHAWDEQSGMLSIWVLGMYPPSPTTTVVVPIKTGSDDQLGPPVNDSYFGKIAHDRLVVKGGAAYLNADGASRGKIGVSPLRTKPVLGSYDAANHLLTIVQFTFDANATRYVNSQWKIQDNPFGGDVANSYNDGPPTPGAKQLGPFYELESSSPAAALAPGQVMVHVHRTIHCTGDEAGLNSIAVKVLGVTLADITGAFK